MASTSITSLQDKRAFPSFHECPGEHSMIIEYYPQVTDITPARHWCFLGEITEKMVFNRLCLRVKDKEGREISVNFHLEPHSGLRAFTPGMSNFPVHRNVPEALVKEGNTIAILYGQRHSFMDGSTGFRIEDADFVQFFAIGNQILGAGPQPEGIRSCTKCKTTTGTLQRCSACHITWYCSKACQAEDWSEGHKKVCKLTKQITVLMNQDWEHFHEYYSFPLAQK